MKQRQRPRREFRWPALPVLDAFVLYDLFDHYSGKDECPVTDDVSVAEMRGYADMFVRHAEREVLHHFSHFALDFGQNVSMWEPHYLIRIAQRCPRTAFPTGVSCLQHLQALATKVGTPAARLGEHGIALERWRVLGNRASSIITICHDDFPDDPSEWEGQTWKAYFRRFPHDLFSLAVLAAVIELADVEPQEFTQREQWVYQQFLPDRTWRPEHVYWDEYDVFPGDDDEDEPEHYE